MTIINKTKIIKFLISILFSLSTNSFAYYDCKKYLDKRMSWEVEDFEKLSLVAYISGAYDLYIITHAKARVLMAEDVSSYLNCHSKTTMKSRLSLIDKYCKKNIKDALWVANSNVFFELSEKCIKKFK